MLKSKLKLLLVIGALGVVILAITNPSLDRHFDQLDAKMMEIENQHIQTCERCQASAQPLADSYEVDREMMTDFGFARKNYLVCSRFASDGPGIVSTFGMLGTVWVFRKDESFPCPAEFQIPSPGEKPNFDELGESDSDIVIVVRIDGSMEYDDATISREDLQGVLEAVEDKAATRIVFMGNEHVKVGTVTEIMKWIESLGLGFPSSAYVAVRESDN